MASIFRIKRSEVSGNPASLGAGELAYSALADNGSNGGDRLYVGMGTETNGNAVNHVVIGGKYFTDMINSATSSNVANTLVRRDTSGAISANIVGDITGTADFADKWSIGRNLSLTGDGTATLSSVDGSANVSAALTLATVNSNVGTYGGTTSVPIITVNAKGLITSVSSATIAAGTINLAGDTGTDTLSLDNDTISILGGTGVTTALDGSGNVTISLGQAVGTTDDVTFNTVTVNGTLNSDDITATELAVSGNATISGNLTVLGTTTTVNSTTVAIGDTNITLSKDATTAAQANGAGLTVIGPTTPATLTYTSADDRWNLNKALTVSTVYGDLVGNADTATKWATARNLSLTGDATATLSNVDGSAAVSAAVTLATVNSNTGSFGDSLTVPTVTVNAKGLVTAVSQTAIPTATTSVKGLATFDSTQFTVTSGSVSIAEIDGGTY